MNSECVSQKSHFWDWSGLGWRLIPSSFGSRVMWLIKGYRVWFFFVFLTSSLSLDSSDFWSEIGMANHTTNRSWLRLSTAHSWRLNLTTSNWMNKQSEIPSCPIFINSSIDSDQDHGKSFLLSHSSISHRHYTTGTNQSSPNLSRTPSKSSVSPIPTMPNRPFQPATSSFTQAISHNPAHLPNSKTH